MIIIIFVATMLGFVIVAFAVNFLQLRTIHQLVNSRLSESLARIDQLEGLLIASKEARDRAERVARRDE